MHFEGTVWKATFYAGSLRNQILKKHMKTKVTLTHLHYSMLITQYSLQKMATIWELGFLILLPKTLTCLKILLTESINWSVSANSKRFLTLSRMVPWWTIMHLAGEALSSGREPGSAGRDGVEWCSSKQETGALSPWGLVWSAMVVLCQPG